MEKASRKYGIKFFFFKSDISSIKFILKIEKYMHSFKLKKGGINFHKKINQKRRIKFFFQWLI